MKLHYSTDDPRLTLSFDGLEHHFELDVDMGGGDATDYNILEPSPTALRIDNEPADMQRFAAVVDHMLDGSVEAAYDEGYADGRRGSDQT